MATTENATVEDGTGQQVLDELNEVLLAIITMFSATTEPANPEPYQSFVNTNVTPPVWNIRNAENNGWIKIAEFENNPTNQIRFFHLGAVAVGAAVANIFTQPQTIDDPGDAGELAIGSDLSAGAAALLRMFAHNNAAADFDGFRIQMSVTDATDGSEDTTVTFQNAQAGTLTTLMTMAAAVLTIAGTLNATTLQQGGTDLDDIVNDAIDSLDVTRELSTAPTLLQSDAGGAILWDGTTNQNVTCGRLTVGSVIVIHNDGTADLTCVSAGGFRRCCVPGGYDHRSRRDGDPDHAPCWRQPG